MKTDALINALAQDNVSEPGPQARSSQLWIAASIACVALLFFAALGVRSDAGASGVRTAMAMKLAVTIPLALLGLFAALPFARAEGQPRQRAMTLLIIPVLLTLFIVIDARHDASESWLMRMIGTKGLHCVTLIPLFSVLPLAAILGVLKRGAVTRPTLASVIAGLAATGIGASFYALNCTDDSPLFVAFWYSIATLIVVTISMATARRVLSW
ncbi:MAG: NrsF family protein [Beijerinckiaceae bacterium]